MSGVYNRKLFRQGPARDELRKLGGIMSSSEELMREALQMAQNAPGPEDLGPMAMPMQQPQMPLMPQQQMMQPQMMQPQMMQPQMMQPQMMQPQMMQPQMMQPQMMQPMQPQPMPQMPMAMGQEPAYMPPEVPGSVQPQGYAEGGEAFATPSRMDAYKTAMSERTTPYVDPVLTQTPEEAIDADVRDKAIELMPDLNNKPPEDVATDILDTASTKGFEPTGDMQTDLARLYQNLTGDPAAFEKNIDSLNRGIIGAAIGAGTSARATENISKGLLVGLQGAKDTEERRLSDARTLQLAEIQARTAEANKKADKEESAVNKARSPTDAFQNIVQAVLSTSTMDLPTPEGMTRDEFAREYARTIVGESGYTPDQLGGGYESTTAVPPPAPVVDDEAYLSEARKAVDAGTITREEAIRRLKSADVDVSNF